ncbi:hypothetical protein OBBRIDRAFT_342413 [Obba rivulosa]|uniref:Uncharacterized protein n=1 Tax=Obba rivulosa TaxID=1052685 RepID=A0A8E2AQX5_9APHY|nr:hypothetical protein OBBRIDRAFT_342413 [Obba rivulosa]
MADWAFTPARKLSENSREYRKMVMVVIVGRGSAIREQLLNKAAPRHQNSIEPMSQIGRVQVSLARWITRPMKTVPPPEELRLIIYVCAVYMKAIPSSGITVLFVAHFL